MITLLSAATATGVSAAKTSSIALDKAMTFQATSTGSPTQVTIDIEGSIDGSTWASLLTQDVTANGGMFSITEGSIAVTQLRANLTVLTGGTTPTVTVTMEAGA